MKSFPILNGATTKNTSGAMVIRNGDGNPFWEAYLALCAAFGAGAKALTLSFDGSPDGNTWFDIQAVDLTTTALDVVESKTISADCTRQLLYCPTSWPWVRVTWALVSDNNATLHLDCVCGAPYSPGQSHRTPPPVHPT